jgi:hypothetical protein
MSNVSPMKLDSPERPLSKLQTLLDLKQQPVSAEDHSKQVKDELSLSQQRILQGSINSKTSNKSIELMHHHHNTSPSRIVLIDMQQGKSIFNSGVNKTDG